jgi:hypothetical protein
MSHVVSKGLTLSPSVRAAYAKCFVCLWFRVGAQRFVIDRSSVQVRIVGSIKFLRFMHLAAALAAITFVFVTNCVVTVLFRSHIAP